MSGDSTAKKMTIIVTKGSLDWAYPPFILATTAAMEMPMMGMHMAMPNLLGAMPGMDAMASGMMKDLIKKKGVASIEELRDMAVEAEVSMIACQMTLDLFEIKRDDLIDGIELGGAATYIERAANAQINLFI